MKIILSGASGLIGSSLKKHLEARGHQIVQLVRAPAQPGAGEALWDPDSGVLDTAVLQGADAVVNLNGRNISDGRWSERVKKILRSSRIDSTTTIASAIADAQQQPPVLVNASATGYYGDRGDELLDESSARGQGFLAELCSEWESAAENARSDRTRVVCLRFGMVLSQDGGALERMLLPFKLGVGGPIGSGRQFWPWVSLVDVVRVVEFAISTAALSGPVNVVAPEEVRCTEFARTLGRALNRPAFLPVPAAAVRLAFGEMAEALLLASARVRPAALIAAGYEFEHPTLEDALRVELD